MKYSEEDDLDLFGNYEENFTNEIKEVIDFLKRNGTKYDIIDFMGEEVWFNNKLGKSYSINFQNGYQFRLEEFLFEIVISFGRQYEEYKLVLNKEYHSIQKSYIQYERHKNGEDPANIINLFNTKIQEIDIITISRRKFDLKFEAKLKELFPEDFIKDDFHKNRFKLKLSKEKLSECKKNIEFQMQLNTILELKNSNSLITIYKLQKSSPSLYRLGFDNIDVLKDYLLSNYYFNKIKDSKLIANNNIKLDIIKKQMSLCLFIG